MLSPVPIHGELLNHHDITGTERIIKDSFLRIEIDSLCARIDVIDTHHIRCQAGSILAQQLGNDEFIHPHNPTDGHLVQFHDGFLFLYTCGVKHLFPKQSPAGSAGETRSEDLGGKQTFESGVFLYHKALDKSLADNLYPLQKGFKLTRRIRYVLSEIFVCRLFFQLAQGVRNRAYCPDSGKHIVLGGIDAVPAFQHGQHVLVKLLLISRLNIHDIALDLIDTPVINRIRAFNIHICGMVHPAGDLGHTALVSAGGEINLILQKDTPPQFQIDMVLVKIYVIGWSLID